MTGQGLEEKNTVWLQRESVNFGGWEGDFGVASWSGAQVKPSGDKEVKDMCSQEEKACQSNRMKAEEDCVDHKGIHHPFP